MANREVIYDLLKNGNKDSRFELRMNKELKKELLKLAKESNITLAELIETSLLQYLFYGG